MSMATLTLWQLAGMFCAYLLVTVGLPAFVFGRRLRGHRAPERFLLYFMTGNFYVMNLVFTLQLLKISYPITLILGTLVPAIIIRIKVNHIPVKEIFLNYAEKLRRLSGGQMGTKTAIYKVGAKLRGQIARFFRWVGFYLFRRFLDCALIALLLAVLWYIYGTNLLEYYGYKTSDLLVHNYWINALGDNNIFVAGVYPHGFHCVVYYLHAVFGIETFVILRLFAFVQNVMLHLMLLCVLRLCCRSRYAAYAGTFIFAASSYFKVYTYYRYYASLPQEFGIIFILPAVYFGFAFFEVRRQEIKTAKENSSAVFMAEEVPRPVKVTKAVKEEKKIKEGSTKKRQERPGKQKSCLWHRLNRWMEKRRTKRNKKKKRGYLQSSIHLAGFCMSFSMTLAVHFYGTMVAGIFCLAMACGYFFLFLRKKYFWKVVVTATLSVTIAVLPMLLAFLGGTPLQGSLGWGMNIITGSRNQAKEEEAQGSVITSGGNSAATSEGGEGTISQGGNTENPNLPTASVGQEEKEQNNLSERISEIWSTVEGRLKYYVFVLPYDDGVQWIMLSFFGLIGLGVFYILVRRVCYGAMLVSTGLYMILMCVMLCAGTFGLPSLMDGIRSGIYIAYTSPMAMALALDGILYLPFFLLRGKAWKVGRVLLNGMSLVCVAGVMYYTVATGHVKPPRQKEVSDLTQEINEAIICLTNIIKGEEDFTWTIVSANDELRMGWDYGYHYETITFLQEMEMAPTDTLIRIPTPVVYFFIEKIPINYNVPYAGSGQSISEEGAALILPGGNGINVYQGMNRWILMSKMYYWAEAFRQLCPNEMDIYMETDSFICYRLEQEPYRLYNLALDYGYNQWGYVAEYAAE